MEGARRPPKFTTSGSVHSAERNRNGLPMQEQGEQRILNRRQGQMNEVAMTSRQSETFLFSIMIYFYLWICYLLNYKPPQRVAHPPASVVLLQALGLESYMKNKLQLHSILDIGLDCLQDKPAQSLKDLPWRFLRRLMMASATARDTRYMQNHTEFNHETLRNTNFPRCQVDCEIHPLDLIITVLHCSDGLLQQEIFYKMAQCQFSVPLLLPNNDTNQCMLMLWAMRDIVKKWRPHSLASTRGFCEESIVLANMPLMSFVRLGKCGLSKSQILNKVLSNPQQHHDFFVHSEMDGGNVLRTVSDGLVEIMWYLPCGKKNIDIFTEPVAIANLRGDSSSFQSQVSFLGEVSSGVFIFFDSTLPKNYKVLSQLKHIKAKVVVIAVSYENTEKDTMVHLTQLALTGSVIFKNKQMNDAQFVMSLRQAITSVLQNTPKVRINDMPKTAAKYGIALDEERTACQNGKKLAEEITCQIRDIPQYKKSELPRQGDILKKLAKLEKEECRLLKAGDQPIEHYRSKLSADKKKLREEQNRSQIATSMCWFITALSSLDEEGRFYFLKWMRLNLDARARKDLSGFQNQYKAKCCNLKENMKDIAKLDEAISNCSLGIEHFMREMGQIYEATCSLPEMEEFREQFSYLPSLGATLLLDGFPLELVDGDASHIPVKWITDVLMALHSKVNQNSRVLVVTILGVQSTGKSTLLNTMFGIQFAVSSGRCTRGAFMQLIKIKEELKKEMNCDFILLLDTEGLKSPELAQLEDSYEHDNELATLVVGLSDVTVVNIAMENSTEMKDILQTVVHAFLRMEDVGKKPKCQFVHQNVGDVSAHEKNMRDRRNLLEQLNEMIKVAARMEKKQEQVRFTDVIEYDAEENNWYVPGLWHGTPPMAPVSTGYSETVFEFKKSLIEVFKGCNHTKPLGNIKEFTKWMESLWRAVKHENFIFSFRNCLVADAYNNLCIEFNQWEWSFRKHMLIWTQQAENRIQNLDNDDPHIGDLDEFLVILKAEATEELRSQEEIFHKYLDDYYKSKDKHIQLVEKYRQTFICSINSLKSEVESDVNKKCEMAVKIQKGMKKLVDIHKEHAQTIETKVLELLKKCRENNMDLSDETLKEEFERMWSKTVLELDFKGLKRQNIRTNVSSQLRINLERHGSAVTERLNMTNNTESDGTFNVKDSHMEGYKICNFFTQKKEKTQKLADGIISDCLQFITGKHLSNSDYHDTYTKELLRIIDERVKDRGTSNIFEVDLKLHICNIAAKNFQKIHDDFIAENDPKKHLEKLKPSYFLDFTDLYHEKNQCQRKATDFIKLCLKPAIRDYIKKNLGVKIVDEILSSGSSVKFSSRTHFQYTLLEELLNKKEFEAYVRYINRYEDFVKNWILDLIQKHFSCQKSFGDLEILSLNEIMIKIQDAFLKAKNKTLETILPNSSKGIADFIEEICGHLKTDLVIPVDNIRAALTLNDSKVEEFVEHIEKSLPELREHLQRKYMELNQYDQSTNIKDKIKNLSFKPQDELFRRVFGCGKQCPFCKVPCEAGGGDHKEHHATVHRPQGLGRCRVLTSEKLVENICTTDVASETVKFQNIDTKGQWHPHKDYRTYYPSWNIPQDTSIEASKYWKYVMHLYNDEFAKEYHAKPANIPDQWKTVTHSQALESLKDSFNLNKSSNITELH
uniref:GTPase, very large interferon inducible 1-like 2 n=1 Tax=Erpetoichthys calabaricus TaxID=27687 RepID=A0A8C4S6V2_ERPCA